MDLLTSVPEMADAGEYHGDVALVGRGDHLGVAHAAAGLDDRDGAMLGDDVEAVAKGKEGVRAPRPSRRATSPAFAAFSAAMRVESTRLICPAPMPSVRRGRSRRSRWI